MKKGQGFEKKERKFADIYCPLQLYIHHDMFTIMMECKVYRFGIGHSVNRDRHCTMKHSHRMADFAKVASNLAYSLLLFI